MPRFTLEIIDRIDTQPLIQWARKQPLTPELFNDKYTKRLEQWHGLGVELLNYGKSWNIFHAPPIEEVPLLRDLRDRYYPAANSCLLYYYPVGVGIGSHIDKPVFHHEVVIINIIDSQPNLFGEKDSIKFKFRSNTHLLNDGDVIRFDALMEHGLPPVKVPRYSLSFRIIAEPKK
ncbi:2OG-Fe(II) oxygenase family protein [Crocosphaera chwakensis]|uniref:Fe2OG dioxygenase domain-containing protein n=1 Tax=Crocosphaera chwakensis CCY0110 TaxID=391612 RepID=A3ITX4_9CHRO|nr:hypothetical protein [Crocosphaera chwakensis]EAZ90069.1 hypothetical protein CY0110_15025 [Crocosphaera chwakensis CCY0110]